MERGSVRRRDSISVCVLHDQTFCLVGPTQRLNWGMGGMILSREGFGTTGG